MQSARSALLALPDRCAATKPKRKRRSASKRITLRQASNMMAGVAFARQIGTPLNAHATIHWAGTKAGDDPDGRLLAKVREGFDKWLRRQGIPDGLSAIWVRERLSGGSAEVSPLPHAFSPSAPLSSRQKAHSSREGTGATDRPSWRSQLPRLYPQADLSSQSERRLPPQGWWT